MKKLLFSILKYAGFGVLAILAPALIIVLIKTVQYKHTVNQVPGIPLITLPESSLIREADPFIGTGGFPPYTAGDDMPGATMPFGMVRLSPDTKFFLGAYLGDGKTVSTAGYYYGDNRLMGFSHTRLVGTGASDGGHFRVLPLTGEKQLERYLKGKYPRFTHGNEAAAPGYFRLFIPESKTLAELTAATHTGIHRYTFSGQEDPCITIDVSSVLGNGKASDGTVVIDTVRSEVTGSIRTYGSFSKRYGGISVYFSAGFSEPFNSCRTWNDGLLKNNHNAKGDHIGAVLNFKRSGDENIIVMKVGISYVSVENARDNREKEAGDLDFETLVNLAQKAWEEKLSSIKIEGGTNKQRKIFYTALYHSLQMPTLFSDVSGEYTGFDKKVHKAENFSYFTDLSLWDTFRTIHPLFTLIEPENQLNMMKSLVTMSQQGNGSLPRWPSGCGYTGSMIGASADIVITESYLKGIKDFDAETAYQAMRNAALAIDIPKEGFKPRANMSECLKYGYCPADLMEDAVSKTLEYAYADDAIAKLAAALGHFGDTALFSEHSKFYRNLWNPETQYFQPRSASGSFQKKFKPRLLVYLDPDNEYTDDYVEGSALQWRWALFFNGGGLVSLFRDREYFVNELNSFFEHSDPTLGSFYPGPYYWHGNEPDIHAAYLFNYAGRPDLTQKWVRWIIDNKYAATYDGIDGDDDAGTLSAWYIFSSLGIYPVAGSDSYQVGAPLFKKAEIRTGEKVFQIVADNLSEENRFVREVKLNDTILTGFMLRHKDIVRGGTLSFEMCNTPAVSKK